MRSREQGLHGEAGSIHHRVADAYPTGIVRHFAGSAIPDGWLECNGQEVRRGQYPDLFAIIGTNYGTPTNASTFVVPDLRGRCVYTVDGGGGLATTAGAETVTLDTTTMAAHNHTLNNGTSLKRFSGLNAGTGTASASRNSLSTVVEGGGGAHNNMQPFLVLRFVIKT
jgi:microcystin-dependent protein